MLLWNNASTTFNYGFVAAWFFARQIELATSMDVSFGWPATSEKSAVFNPDEARGQIVAPAWAESG